MKTLVRTIKIVFLSFILMMGTVYAIETPISTPAIGDIDSSPTTQDNNITLETPPDTPVIGDSNTTDNNSTTGTYYQITDVDIENKKFSLSDNCSLSIYDNNTLVEVCNDGFSENGRWIIETGMLKVAESDEEVYQAIFNSVPEIGTSVIYQSPGEQEETVTITAIEDIDPSDAPDSNITLPNDCTAYQWEDKTGTCQDIIAPSESELNAGVWHEILKEDGGITKYAACVDISLSGGSGSLTLTELEKSGTIYSEDETITSYDSTTGALELEFKEDGKIQSETVYITYLDSNKTRQFLVEREDDGTLQLFRELENRTSCDTDNLEYTSDYENYNSNKEYTVGGNIILPAGSDMEVHMQARSTSGQWVSHSEIDYDNNGTYLLGFDTVGQYLIEANYESNGQWENYFYDGVDQKWISGKTVDFDPVVNGVVVDDDQPDVHIDHSQVFEWMPQVNYLTVDTNITGLNFDMAAMENSFYKIQGSVVVAKDFNATEFCRDNSDQIGICEWTDGGTHGSGFNNWAGENGIRIEVSNALTGERITETKITNSSNESNSTATTKTLDFELKLPSYGEYIIRVNKQTFDSTTANTWEQQQWESFYFNPSSGKLIDEGSIDWKETDSVDNWGNKIWAPDTDLTGKIEISEVTDDSSKTTVLSKTIDFISFLSSQVKFGGTVEFDSGEIYVEMINLSNGNYFGWSNLKPDNDNNDFNITLPSTEIGDKYALRVSLSTSNSWESYFINLTDPANPKFVSERNIDWKSYIKDDDGVLKEYESDEWTPEQIWLPEIDKLGALELADTNGDGEITQADIVNTSIKFASMDDQYYILDGKVIVPSTFIPGEVCKLSDGSIGYEEQCWNDSGSQWLGWNNVNFEVRDRNSGESVLWDEIDRDSNATYDSDKSYDYKLMIDSAGEYIVRVNLDSFDTDTQSSSWSGYYVNYNTNPISLVSDRKIQHIPVLKDENGVDFVANGKTSNSCWDDGGFWWHPEGQTDGSCYDEHPHNWIPDSNQTGFVTLSETTKKVTEEINFVNLENNVYKITGTVTVPAGFEPSHDWDDRKMIRIEAIDSSTGEWIGDGDISNKPVDGTSDQYKYSFKLDGAVKDANITIKLVKEEKEADDWSWESYYINFGDDNSVGGTGSAEDTLISEESINWIEVEQSGKSWNMWLPDPSQTGFITLGDNKTISLDVDYSAMVSSYEDNKKSLYGTITLSEAVTLGQVDGTWHWNNIRVEAIDKNTGEWIADTEAECNSTSCSELTYELELVNDGEYIIKLSKSIDGKWEEYYYNFGDDNNVSGENKNADKIVDGQKVHWKEASTKVNDSDHWTNWMPDWDKTGWINFSTKTKLDIDISTFENSILSISGTITLPGDFILGEYCTNDAGDEARCDWQTGYQNGYTNWSGAKNVRVEAINKTTGDWIASQEIVDKIENENRYTFKLKLGDASEVGSDFVIKFNKEQNTQNSWKSDEIFYDFGTNNTFEGIDSSSDGEKLVNGRKIDWIETNSTNQWGHKNWMPNPNETGWITMTDSVSSIDVDLSQFGANDYYLKGEVTFKSDFNISNDNSWADVSVIDASTGKHIGNSPISEDGTYELNLGEDTGEYVLQVHYSYNDYQNWENSWWKNKYYDFGADKAYGGGDDSLLTDMEVKWVPILKDALTSYTQDHECWQSGNFWNYEAGNSAACYPQPEHWRPDANPIVVDSNSATQIGTKKIISGVDIDLSAKIGSTLNIDITNLPQNASNKYVYVTNPMANVGGNWQHIDGSSIALEELKAGDYTVEFGYDLDGKYYNYFILDDNSDLSDGVGAVLDMEVRWEELDSSTHSWGPSAEDTTYISMSNDLNLSITIPTITLNDVNITLNGLEDGENVNIDFKSTSKPYGRWESTTSANSKAEFNFDDIKDGDYFASFWYDENQYVCDGANCEEMKKDPQWIAKVDGEQVCPKANNDWDCNWDNSNDWIWTPDVTPLTISGDSTIDATVPAMKKITGAIDLSSEYADGNVDVSIFKHNGDDWNWENYTLDENGDVNSSMRIAGGEDYRIEIWIDGLGGYVYDNAGTPSDTSDDSWISQHNSWEENNVTHMWEPKPTTLIDITSNQTLKVMDIGSDYKKVTVIVNNLDEEDGSIVENVWVSLESDTQGYYGEDNANWDVHPVTYDGNVTLKVPASSDYRLLVFPMNHTGGFASDGSRSENTISSGATLSTIGWDEKDLLDVTSNTTITVSLPSAATLGSIDGDVTCGASDCSGWIDAFNSGFGKGAPVNSDGSFEIKGMDAGDYEVNYWAYAQELDGLMLRKEDVTVSGGSTTTITLAKEASNMYSSIIGNINDQDAYAVLIKTDGTTWEVMATEEIDINGDFSFGELPKPSTGKTYLVAAAKRTKNEDYSSSVKFTQPQDLVSAQGVNIGDLNFGTPLTGITVTGQTNE